ncbi:protein S-acyltransferase [Malassezia cuniculi]|uniref:Rhomboid-type serine protease n=1 Tax=Malassezia cuniculi TaxID=948313 RepID=A0AAF0ES84_9BASI|nr:protein S-acyltransferase [Malassezia cuniculi]
MTPTAPPPLEPSHVERGYDYDNTMQYPPATRWGSSGSVLPLTAGGEYPDESKLAGEHHKFEYADIYQSEPVGKYAWNNPEVLQRQINKRQQGKGRQRWPIFSWILAVALLVIFIIELALSAKLTGQAVQTKPQVQPMIGPPVEFLIHFGARFVPCMRKMPNIDASESLPCLNYSTADTTEYHPSQLCSIADLCGLDDPGHPNQAYRFISAVFVHAGIVHILFNLVVLLTLCCEIEKLVGTPVYIIVFMAGGIGGNLLGGNFGLIGQPALGVSGAVYTCISFEIVDLLYNREYEPRAMSRVVVSIIVSLIGLGLGLLPGIDNFSHIGGFCLGILGGMVFAPSIHSTKAHFVACWIIRMIGLSLAVAYFVSLTLNFYNSTDPANACQWCRYLSCLPMFSSCRGIGITTATSKDT